MNPYETITLTTDVGDYKIHSHYDDGRCDLNPLENIDLEGIALYVYTDGYVAYNELSDAGEVGGVVDQLLDQFGTFGIEVERRFRKWQAITGDTTELVTGTLLRYGGYVKYVALIYDGTFWGDATKAVHSIMKEWCAWADGEVYGYVVEGPDGEEIDSCWGYIGDDEQEYMVKVARSSIDYDVAIRKEKASLAGAGFVGII